MGNGHPGRGHGLNNRRARRHAQRQRGDERVSGSGRTGEMPVLLSPSPGQQTVSAEAHAAHAVSSEEAADADHDYPINEQAPADQAAPATEDGAQHHNGNAEGGRTGLRRTTDIPYQPGHRHNPARYEAPPALTSTRSAHPLPMGDTSDADDSTEPEDPAASSDSSPQEHPLTNRPDVRGDVGPLIDSLHAVFEHDRAIASQGQVSRCGICYLFFPLSELTYRTEEGFYCCASCARSLGNLHLPMVHRQQRL